MADTVNKNTDTERNRDESDYLEDPRRNEVMYQMVEHNDDAPLLGAGLADDKEDRTSQNSSLLDDQDVDSGERGMSDNEERTESDAGNHCHAPAQSDGSTTARNQLIAVSVLCALFMGAEITGTFGPVCISRTFDKMFRVRKSCSSGI